MTTRSFLALAMSLPLLLGLIGLLLPIAAMPFGAALLFGGIPYIPFGILMAYLIKRAATKRRLVLLSLFAPLIFVPCVIAFVLVVGWYPGATMQEALEQTAPFSAFTLMFGYFYVLLAWVLWAGARRLGLVRDEFAT